MFLEGKVLKKEKLFNKYIIRSSGVYFYITEQKVLVYRRTKDKDFLAFRFYKEIQKRQCSALLNGECTSVCFTQIYYIRVEANTNENFFTIKR